MEIKKVQHTLLAIFLCGIVNSFTMVILFESGLLPVGIFAFNKNLEFLFAATMEVLTMCIIPFAIWFFRSKKVKSELTIEDKVKASENLLKWGVLRLGLLSVLMIFNTLLYYFFMNVAFGYMAIITFLALFFVEPSMDRCKQEIGDE